MTTPPERIEEIRQKLNKVYLRLAYGKSDIETAKKEVDEILHQELQKAREEERERIIKIINDVGYVNAENLETLSLSKDEQKWYEGCIDVCEHLSETLQSELDQPNK